MESAVAHERPGQETRLAEDLESVANAENRRAAARGLAHGRHDGGVAGDGAAAQVVAEGKPAGGDDCVVTLDGRLFVPDGIGSFAERVTQGAEAILVAVGAGEPQDGEFHHSAISKV